MLAILTTHPIQYQVPLWQLLARETSIPFEVWYLSKHATERSRDVEFKQEFAWDLDMLSGYNYRLLKTPPGATPNTPFRTRIVESLPRLFAETKTKVLWVQGWQVAAYWQAVWAANRAGVRVWMRGESNALREQRIQRSEDRGQRTEKIASISYLRSPISDTKRLAKRLLLAQLFERVDHFLCIGTANRDLYRSYGVPESKLQMAMYAVDNARFAQQASGLRGKRKELRREWGIGDDAFVVLFCGKFIPKKHPMDLIEAAKLLLSQRAKGEGARGELPSVHLLFVGSGELGAELRSACNVVYDAEIVQRSVVRGQLPARRTLQLGERSAPDNRELITDNAKPAASFAGFLNQTQVSRAYVAADVLVLPSDYDETWGLVVNEAMSSGLPCIISDRCGCAPDLGNYPGNSVYRFEDIDELAHRIVETSNSRRQAADESGLAARAPRTNLPSFQQIVEVVAELYANAATSLYA
jgi:glycosyltransferase involved in cell wall biosynthesis